jgi:hypothetical protein
MKIQQIHTLGLLVLAWMFVTAHPGQAQSGPLGGLSWGATIAQVKQEFPSVRKARIVDADFPEARLGAVTYEDGPVAERTFVVNKGALVKVIETYAMARVDLDDFMERLQIEYGKPVGTDFAEEIIEEKTVGTFTVHWENGTTRVRLVSVNVAGVDTELRIEYFSRK